MARKRRKFTQCPNCTYSFNEVNNFCPNCGQENHDLNVPVKHLLWEFLEGTMHYDTKALRTLRYLLFKPGKLTNEFNVGRRASYVPPFRLYVFVSLVFFSVLALRANNTMLKTSNVAAPSPVSTTAPIPAGRINEYDASLTNAVKPNSVITGSRILQDLQVKFGKFTRNQEQSRQKLLKNTSFMMFALMPFFGFILYLFYYRKKRNYVEHLMFSVHFHTFFFLLTVLAIPVELIFKGFDVDFWVFWICIIYLFLALHRVYKDSYLRTFIKFLPIALVYLFSLGVLFMGTLAVSIFLS